MGRTNIPWCDFTFNPWWGCTTISAGCQNCYAERESKRFGFDLWGPDRGRRFFGAKCWNEPLRWNAAAEKAGVRHRVLCGSMCDIMEDARLPGVDAARRSLWSLIDATPALDWLLLTKRPENFVRFLPERWQRDPHRNVWLLTTAADQAEADKNIPALLNVPAVVHGVSCEPLLGPIELVEYGPEVSFSWLHGYGSDPPIPKIDWVIVGGESGPHGRPMHPDWARSLRDQCQAEGAPFFFKQWGKWRNDAGDLLDGRKWHEFPAGEENTEVQIVFPWRAASWAAALRPAPVAQGRGRQKRVEDLR